MIATGPVSGAKLDTDAPDVSRFTIEDIAHALSHLCRWHGSTLSFYSVAEQCVRGLEFMPDEDAERCWLMHESAEALALADIPSPLRTASFNWTEARILRAVVEKYGLVWPFPEIVKEIDSRMAATEAAQLLHPNARAHLKLTAKPIRELVIEPWSPARARKEWLREATRLGIA